MILYGKTVGTETALSEIVSAAHTGVDAQALQTVVGPVHDAFGAVPPEYVTGDVTITIPRAAENDGPLVVTLCTAAEYAAMRAFLDRDRSGVGAAGHVIE